MAAAGLTVRGTVVPKSDTNLGVVPKPSRYNVESRFSQ